MPDEKSIPIKKFKIKARGNSAIMKNNYQTQQNPSITTSEIQLKLESELKKKIKIKLRGRAASFKK